MALLAEMGKRYGIDGTARNSGDCRERLRKIQLSFAACCIDSWAGALAFVSAIA
jgi:hypothetical protein